MNDQDIDIHVIIKTAIRMVKEAKPSTSIQEIFKAFRSNEGKRASNDIYPQDVVFGLLLLFLERKGYVDVIRKRDLNEKQYKHIELEFLDLLKKIADLIPNNRPKKNDRGYEK